MTVLYWARPKRVRTAEEHAASFSADSAPPGTYVPNMSAEDAGRWKAKMTGKRRGTLQVEIRKSLRGSQLIVIVSLGEGYVYKHYGQSADERGVNVHLATNGPLQMTFEDMTELNEAVAEARTALMTAERELA